MRVAIKTIELKGTKFAKELRKAFLDFHMLCFEAHENALKAFFSGDIALAEEVRNIREKIEKTFTNIEKLGKAQPLEFVPQILAIASFLRQIYEHSVDIADLVMPKDQSISASH